MILAALVMQTMTPAPSIDPQGVVESFLTICVHELGDPAALREAIRRSPLGFARVADDQRFEVYQSGQARIRFEPGLGCEFETRMLTYEEGLDAIARLAAMTEQEIPAGAVNRPGTAASYLWPPGEAGRPGLTAGLEWGRLGSRRPGTMVRLDLWAYRAVPR